MDSDPDQDKKDVAEVISAFFEAGKNKDLAALPEFYAHPSLFTKFDENPPYTRQNSEQAFVHEQAAFANISDYNYRIEDLRIDLIEKVAVCTFYLAYTGIFVNDYSFEGSPVGSRVRATMVFLKTKNDWKIAHEHLSRFPDWKQKEEGEQRLSS